MDQQIPPALIEQLMDLGALSAEEIKDDDELVATLTGMQGAAACGAASWEAACETLSRNDLVFLLRGLVYADILAWGPSPDTPANAVFSVLNKRCWPDTVYQVIGWALHACERQAFSTDHYVFKGMLANR